MELTVVLLGMHRAFLPPAARQEGRVTLDLEGSEVDVTQVLAALGMPVSTSRIVFLDGEAIGDDRKLHDGETITFVSPVGGG